MSKRKRKQQPRHSNGSHDVTEYPASCPRCQSTEMKAVRVVADRPLAGRMPGGRPYDRVIWRDKRCDGCGARVRVRTFQHPGRSDDAASEEPRAETVGETEMAADAAAE